METTICLIRHGQTNINHLRKIQGRKNHLLNETGKKQALETGLFLKQFDNQWDYIYSSPLDRAYETACIIKDVLNLKVEVIKDNHFIERDFGDAEDQPITDEIFKEIINDNINNLEKSFEIQKRVSEGIFNITKKHQGKKILIISHSHAIKGLLTFIDKNRTFLDPLLNCSISYFKENNGVLTIDKVNLTPNNL